MLITGDEIKNSEVKALSWRQPYGTLMLYGKQETRTWKTQYRGLVLLCASQKPYKEQQIYNISGISQTLRIRETLAKKRFPVLNSHAFAIGRLVTCFPMCEAGRYDTLEEAENKTFVMYNGGLYVHYFEDIRPIKPLPWIGGLNYRDITEDQKGMITVL